MGSAFLPTRELLRDIAKALGREPNYPAVTAQAAADLLLEAMQDPGLQARYLRDVPPLVEANEMERLQLFWQRGQLFNADLVTHTGPRA